MRRSFLILSLIAFVTSPGIAQSEMQWHSFEEAIAIAEKTGKPVFVDIWAPWCGWCSKMKKEVYPRLNEELGENYILTRLNRDDNRSVIHIRGQIWTPLRLAQKLQAETVPTIAMLNSKGDYLLHITGFTGADKLAPVLGYISSEAYKNKSFYSYVSTNYTGGEQH